MNEIELEAMEILKSRWSHLYTFGYPKKPFPTNYENDLNNIMIGLASKYVEKQKIEFAIEQLKDIDKKCFGGSNTCKAKVKELEEKLNKL